MARLRQWIQRTAKALHWQDVPAFVRRVIVAVVGGTVLLFGLALLVLPGPALLVIPLGLAILATEFVWARRWLRKASTVIQDAKRKVTR